MLYHSRIKMPPQAHRTEQDRQLVAQLASQWASCIVKAERPSPFSYRDGSVLRLVPANERLSAPEMQANLAELLAEQQHILQLFQQNVQVVSSRSKIPRHLAAWARGHCYLQTGNKRQALRDAHAAMAYAAAAATISNTHNPPVSTTNSCTSTPNAAYDVAAAGSSSSSSISRADSQSGAATAAALGSAVHMPTCTWVPALILAAEAYAAHDDWSQAVVHYAAAALVEQDNNVITSRLTAVSARLPVEQAVAFRTGSLSGLLQQLQLEAELKLPEVLRPRPKWYYYNKWMTQRIHIALLEYHLGCSLGSGTSQELLEAAQAIADEPAVAAAAAAAGFGGLLIAAASSSTADREAEQTAHAGRADSRGCSGNNDCLARPRSSLADSDQKNRGLCTSSDHWHRQLIPAQPATGQVVEQQQPLQGALRLPEPVISKLLTLDAGDLDLMIQHPQALQAQVYELMDVLESAGPQAVEQHAVPPLTWEEVQVLTGPDTVGLPLGYKPTAARTQLKPAARPLLGLHDTSVQSTAASAAAVPGSLAAGRSAAAVGQSDQSMLQVSAAGETTAAAAAAVQGDVIVSQGGGAARHHGWWRRGHSRSQYLLGGDAEAS